MSGENQTIYRTCWRYDDLETHYKFKDWFYLPLVMACTGMELICMPFVSSEDPVASLFLENPYIRGI